MDSLSEDNVKEGTHIFSEPRYNGLTEEEYKLEVERLVKADLESNDFEKLYNKMLEEAEDSAKGVRLDEFIMEVRNNIMDDTSFGKITKSKSLEIGPKPILQSGYERVTELKEKLLIPEKYWKFIPEYCECGCPIIATTNLSTFKCSNFRCDYLIASSILGMCKDFSISNVGPETALKFVEEKGYGSVLDFIEYPPLGFRDEVEKITRDEKEFGECVRILNLQNINSRANDIFKGIESYEQYKSEVEKAGGLLEFLIIKLGGTGKLAGMIVPVLESHEYELSRIGEVFKLKREAELEIKLAITGNVVLAPRMLGWGPTTKPQFLNALNRVYPEYVRFKKTETVNQALYVICDDLYSTTSKAVEGRAQNKLVSSDIFVKYVQTPELFLKNLFPNSWESKVLEVNNRRKVNE